MESDEGDAALDEEEVPEVSKGDASAPESAIVPSINGLVPQDSIDGFDDYGNVLPMANLRKRKHITIPPEPPEPWANPPNTLPMQPYSFVGMAALDVNQRSIPLMLPQGIAEVDAPVIARVLAKLNLKPQDPKTPLQVASLAQTRLYQDGYNATHLLTVLEGDEVSALLRTEVQELTNAAQQVLSPDDMLPPRSMAMTFLCTWPSSTLTDNHKRLLDAAAHLASEPGSDGEHADVRAAAQLRMAFLHGDLAKTYAEAHRNFATTRCQCLRGPCNELCLTWPEAMPIGESGYHIRSEFVTIKHCDTADEYVTAILDAIVSLWRDHGVVPGPLRLLGSYAHGAAATDAYARHCLACAHAFWSKVETHHPAELSEYASNDPKYCGALEWSNLWAKIVPRNTPLDGPNVSHGILLHQQGRRDQAREYLKRVKAEESERGADGAFGLRVPMDSTEIATCPHLMVVNAERLHLGHALSCFGLRGVPGESFGGTLPRLVWRLLPITTTLTESVYVLPCHEENIYNAQQVTNWALRSTNHRASRFYSLLMGEEGPTAPNLPAVDEEDRAPTEDEKTLTLMLGLPLSCKAFRIGDVANALQALPTSAGPRAHPVVPHGLACFLVAAAAALSPEASIDDAFGWASVSAERVDKLEAENAKMATQIEDLQCHLKAANANNPSPPDILRSWGRVSDMSGAMFRALNNPIGGVSLKTVLATVGDAAKDVDANVQQQTYEWARSKCCKKKLNDLDRIARVCHHALSASTFGTRRVFLVVTSEAAPQTPTTIYELFIGNESEDTFFLPVKTKEQLKLAKDAKGVVVLAWMEAQRALAALLPQ